MISRVGASLVGAQFQISNVPAIFWAAIKAAPTQNLVLLSKTEAE